MARYIIKRILMAIPVLIGATFLVFAIMDFTPSDPARIILGSNATEEALANLRASMGLNDPFLVRYGRFLLGLLHGDLGTSYRNNKDVFELILGRLGNTVVLATSGILFSVIVGIPVGIISAIKQYSRLDNITMFITLFLMAVPTFWFALILVIIFSLNLGWLPSSGMQHGFPDNLISLILPTLTLGCGYAALIARTTRSSVLEVVRQDYIDMARAKGLTENAVIWKHMLKNALIPIVTIITSWFVSIFGGSVVIESIFLWNGLGNTMLTALRNLDSPLYLAMMMFYVVITLIGNLLMDIAYCVADPRVKLQ